MDVQKAQVYTILCRVSEEYSFLKNQLLKLMYMYIHVGSICFFACELYDVLKIRKG